MVRWFVRTALPSFDCRSLDGQSFNHRRFGAENEPALLHPESAVGDGGHRRIVGHDDDGRRPQRLEVGKDADDLLLGKGVEVVGRLIGEQKTRLCRQCPGQRHPPLLATGKLGRIGIPAFQQPYPLEQRLRPRTRRPAAPAGDQLWQHHIVEGPQSRQQHALLGQEADLLGTGRLGLLASQRRPWAACK